MDEAASPDDAPANASAGLPEPSPITRALVTHHRALLELCGQLENIADCLPDNVDGQQCLVIARGIFSTVKQAHEFEEDRVFPALGSGGGTDANLDRSIERLRFEHWEDESYAEEIGDRLLQFVTDPKNRDVEVLSYMLRGFFEGMRRHIAFETEHLLPRLERGNRH